MPETVFGSRQQISFIGDCLNGATSSTGAKQLCTYTPGLKTDESSIDPKTLIPSRIPTTSQFGDVVTAASKLAMKQPGFQAGANGQILGIDLYFPRIGVQNGNIQGTKSTYDRFESTSIIPKSNKKDLATILPPLATPTPIPITIVNLPSMLVNKSPWAKIQHTIWAYLAALIMYWMEQKYLVR